MKKLFLLVLTAAFAAASTTTTFAAIVIPTTVIASFTFDGSVGSEVNYAANTLDIGSLQSCVITRGPGILPASGAGSFSSSGFSAAFDASEYYSITLTPVVGVTISPIELALDGRRSGTGPLNWELRSSVDSYSMTLVSGSLPEDTTVHRQTAAIGGMGDFSTPVELRLYAYGASSGSGTWRLDNIDVSSAVPEPKEYGEVAAGGLVMFFFARKVRKRLLHNGRR